MKLHEVLCNLSSQISSCSLKRETTSKSNKSWEWQVFDSFPQWCVLYSHLLPFTTSRKFILSSRRLDYSVLPRQHLYFSFSVIETVTLSWKSRKRDIINVIFLLSCHFFSRSSQVLDLKGNGIDDINALKNDWSDKAIEENKLLHQ